MRHIHLPFLIALVLSLQACGGGGGGGGEPRIQAPSAGSFWSGTRVVRWTPFDADEPVSIQVSDGNGWSTLIGGTPDDGAYPWDTTMHEDGGTYRVRVSVPGQEPLTSGLFTLDNTAPVVTLVAPVGGELWGGSRDVLWTTVEANPEYVDILASSDGGTTFDIPIGVATPDDGLHAWDTSTQPDGDQYRMQVVATDKAGNVGLAAFSGGDFELDNTAPVVSLTAPLGGEDWDLERTVTWTTTDANAGTVDLWLSTDGGATFPQSIVADAPDTGAYAWQTGYAPDGNAMRVRVVAIDGAGNVSAPDSSPGDFTITNLRLLDPVHYLDVDGDARIDEGDELYLLFDKEIALNGADPDEVELAVVADTFGAGATLALGPELHSVVVTLGSDPVLRTRGAFVADVVEALRPAGVDVSASMTPDAIEQAATGRDAAPSGHKDVTPGFVARAALPVGSDATSRGALGDLDGDGDLDLVVGSTAGAADVRYAGDGAGGWSAVQALGSSDTRDVALGDLDGDGDLDLVVAAFGTNRVWRNDGTGVLTDTGQALGGESSRAVVLADLDRDGDLDAAFGNDGGQPNTVWWNDGTGSFADSGQALGGAPTTSLAVGDLDGDGDLDLVSGNDAVLSRSWLNDGNGLFSAGGMLTLTSVRDVALGDLDGDGHLDAFLAALGQNEVLLGTGDGDFAPTHDYLGNNEHRAVALLDLDGDGDLDAVTAKYLDAERYWLNDGTGNFVDDPRRGEPDDATDVLAGRIDQDADEDLVLVNDQHAHRTYLASLAGGQPAADLSDSGVSTAPWRSGRATAGDVNGDGAVDVVVPDRSQATHALFGDGEGGLVPGSVFGGPDARGGALFDADRDGDLDYLQWLGEPGTVADRLWTNEGTGLFTDAGLSLALDTLVAGDLDGDGDPDLVGVDGGGFEVWAGDGTGGFTPTGSGGSTSGLVAWAFEDLDADGDLDLVYVRAADTQVWANDGAGGFALATTVAPGGVSRDVAVSDYDRDGDPDLVLGTDVGLAFVRNEGGLTFAVQAVTGPSGVSQVLPVDFNEDGFPDFLAVDRAQSRYYLLPGDGTASLSAQPASVVDDLAHGLLVDLDGDGDLDVYWSRDDTVTPGPVADRVDLFD